MPYIHLTTFIAAPVARVFDLSRSIDLHKASMKKYGEAAVQGTTFGLMGQGDTVTWRAKHLFKERFLKVKLTFLKKPYLFIEEQVEGVFKTLKHEHYFKEIENGTLVIDQFRYEIGRGKLGVVFNNVYLKKYIERLLEERNKMLKEVAEGSGWKNYLS
ncbi:MAG TPA: SRPBCC family protein [Chitinophagaceae bacterium]|nr:SRPBCC family protein [Chitinophagaceae bacterium]